MGIVYLIEVTSQPRATANLHMREPRKPLPPQTTIFLAAEAMMVGELVSSFTSLRNYEEIREELRSLRPST